MRLAIPISILVAFLYGGILTYRNYVRIGNTTAPVFPNPENSDGIAIERLLDGDELLRGDFTIVRRTEELPDQLKAAFAEEVHEPFALSNPGEKFQASDVIANPKLPKRRLVFAGLSRTKWFIHYEQGGIGRFYGVIIFDLDSANQVRPVRHLHGLLGANDLRALRKSIAVGGFHRLGE